MILRAKTSAACPVWSIANIGSRTETLLPIWSRPNESRKIKDWRLLMAIINWKDCYATGIKTFDDEHRELVTQINALFEAIRNKETDKVLPEILAKLTKYTLSHFAHEEEVMTTHAYPDLKAHQKKHEELKKKVAKFTTQLEKGDPKLPLALFNFLREWLLQHIVEVDMNYVEYLREKGVA